MAKSNFSGFRITTGVRIIDIGGWTETWFAKFGAVCSLSVLSRYFGSSGDFLGVEVIASAEKSGELNGGEVSVIASDPNYNCRTKIAEIVAGNFDKTNLLLASLSLCPCRVRRPRCRG